MVGQLRQPTPGKWMQSLVSMNLLAPVSTCILSSLFFICFFLYCLRELVQTSRHFISTGHREEKCDVTLPWQLDFWISTISLDRDGRLHCRTMEEKYGHPTTVLSLSAIKHSKIVYLQDRGLLRARNFATLATWRDDFSLFHSLYIWSDSDAVGKNLILITTWA